tara:strand:- start:4195 stop:5787 length:1593 start_codon:yes stop_codon:yes gene_type:complete
VGTKLFLKIISTIGSLTFLSRILGYFRDLLIARLLGASFISDAFFVSFKLPNLFRRLFAEGAMNSAFIPVISGIKVKYGISKSNQFLSQVLSIIFSILLPFLIIFEIFMPFIISMVAPGFEENFQKFQLTVELSRITFPFLLFICLSSLIGGYLNTMSKFAAMAFIPVILNLSMLTALLSSDFFSSNQETISMHLAFSISFAGLVQLIWLIYNLKKNNVKLKLNDFTFFNFSNLSEDAKKLLYLFIPAALGNGVYQLNLLIDMILASTLPDGSISYLYFADRVNQLPLGVIGIALSTALLPILSKQIKEKAFDEASKSSNYCLQIGIIFSIPASIGLIFLSDLITNVLFVRGEFTINNAKLTSDALKAFCIGLPAFIFVKILAVSFFSREDTKTPVYVAIIAMIINLTLNLILIKSYLHVGLAIATSISSWFNFLILLFLSNKKKFITLHAETFKVLLKSILASGIMGFIIYYILSNYFLEVQINNHFNEQILLVLGLIIFGSFIYLILLYFLKAFYLFNFRLGEKNQTK